MFNNKVGDSHKGHLWYDILHSYRKKIRKGNVDLTKTPIAEFKEINPDLRMVATLSINKIEISDKHWSHLNFEIF